MKCPFLYRINQINTRKILENEDNIEIGGYNLFVEIQGFCECYQEECVAWDKEKKKCRKVVEI